MRKLKLPTVSLDQPMNAREKIFSAIIMVVLLILFMNLFWTPQSATIEAQRSDLENVRMEMDAIKRLIDSAKNQLMIQREFPKKKKKADEKVERMMDRTVVDPLSEIHSTIGLLSSRRFSRKVEVEDVNIGDTVEREEYSEVPIYVQLSARYGGLIQFFGKLENIDRPMVVKGFELDEGGDEGIIEGSIDVVLFIVKR